MARARRLRRDLYAIQPLRPEASPEHRIVPFPPPKRARMLPEGMAGAEQVEDLYGSSDPYQRSLASPGIDAAALASPPWGNPKTPNARPVPHTTGKMVMAPAGQLRAPILLAAGKGNSQQPVPLAQKAYGLSAQVRRQRPRRALREWLGHDGLVCHGAAFYGCHEDGVLFYHLLGSVFKFDELMVAVHSAFGLELCLDAYLFEDVGGLAHLT